MGPARQVVSELDAGSAQQWQEVSLQHGCGGREMTVREIVGRGVSGRLKSGCSGGCHRGIGGVVLSGEKVSMRQKCGCKLPPLPPRFQLDPRSSHGGDGEPSWKASSVTVQVVALRLAVDPTPPSTLAAHCL